MNTGYAVDVGAAAAAVDEGDAGDCRATLVAGTAGSTVVAIRGRRASGPLTICLARPPRRPLRLQEK